jgi:hypothetical protein
VITARMPVAKRLWTPRSARVVYVGGGTNQGNTTTATSPVSWTETVPASANLAIVWFLDVVATVTPTPTATLGGTSMTLTQNFNMGTFSGSFVMYTYCFTMFNPPAGSKAFVVTEASTSGLGWGGTAYYANVGTLGSITTITQSNASPILMNVTSTKQNILYAAAMGYGAVASGDSLNTFNQTQRCAAGCLTASANSSPFVFGDAPGNGGTLNFSVNRSETTDPGGGAMALPLIPRPLPM